MSEASNVVVMPGSDEHRVQVTGVLLRTPRWVSDLPDHDVVYALRDGFIGRCPLARYRVPEEIREGVLAMPDIVPEPTLAALPTIAAVVNRLAPWVTVHLVPKLATRGTLFAESRAGGPGFVVGERLYAAAGGVCFASDDIIIVSMSSPAYTVSSVCHELLHASWWRLSEQARGVLKAAATQGLTWGSDYYDDPEERIARLFAHWCSARIEGMPSTEDADFWSMEGLFQWIWEGGLADHQIVRGLVPGHEALRIRRGLQPLPPPQPEPLPAPPPRPDWGDVVTDLIWDGCAAGVSGVGRLVRWAWRMAAAA